MHKSGLTFAIQSLTTFLLDTLIPRSRLPKENFLPVRPGLVPIFEVNIGPSQALNSKKLYYNILYFQYLKES